MFATSNIDKIACRQCDLKSFYISSCWAIFERARPRGIGRNGTAEKAIAFSWVRGIEQTLGINESLKVCKNNTRLNNRPAAIVVFDEALDLIQFVSGKHNTAESNAATHGAGARARNGYRSAVASGSSKNLSNLFVALRKDNAIRAPIANVAGIGEERLDFVRLRFDQHAPQALQRRRNFSSSGTGFAAPM